MLFTVQRARCLNLDSSDRDNVDVNASIDSDVHSRPYQLGVFEKRLGRWTATHDIDKKLLLGVIMNQPKLVRKEKKQEPSPRGQI